jgi:hypothetical protein
MQPNDLMFKKTWPLFKHIENSAAGLTCPFIMGNCCCCVRISSLLFFLLSDHTGPPDAGHIVQTTVSSGEAAVIERWGKFSRVADPGLHLLMCPCEAKGGTISLRVQQLECVTVSKTKDNVQITVKVSSVSRTIHHQLESTIEP